MLSWKEFANQFSHSARDLVDVEALKQSGVVIFGGGAVGSRMVELLCRSFVGRLTLWDFDTVAVSNLCRSVYDARNLGLSKAQAAATLCGNINPLVKVTAVEGDLLKAPEIVVAKIAIAHGAAVVAADDFRVHRRVNRILYPVTDCVFPYVTNSGDAGEVVWTSPGERGCLECLTNAEERAAAGVAGDFQALGTDVLRVALEATCVVLGILLRGKKGGDLYGDYVNRSSHLLLVLSRMRGPVAGALPGDVVSGTVHVDTSGSRQGCSVCDTRQR